MGDPRRRRHRFLGLAAVVALAAVGASTGLGFAASTGATGAVATGAGGASVLPAQPGMSLPHAGAQARLEVADGVPGQVAQAGDLFLVDTTAARGGAHASLYVTNLAAASVSLRGFVLPVALWTRTTGGWRRDDAQRYLTSAAGSLQLRLDPGRVYAVSLERGGAWVGGAGAPVAPRFYLSL